MNHWRVFIDHPKNNRRKKNKLVGRSMQKNAQPRFTMMKVRAQLTSLPPSDGGRFFRGALAPTVSSAGSLISPTVTDSWVDRGEFSAGVTGAEGLCLIVPE